MAVAVFGTLVVLGVGDVRVAFIVFVVAFVAAFVVQEWIARRLNRDSVGST